MATAIRRSTGRRASVVGAPDKRRLGRHDAGAPLFAPARLARSREGMMAALSDTERNLIDAYWRAANYLSVGQIYLYDNPLLKQPLTKDHIRTRRALH
jgi:hypothetical protein